MTTTDDLLQNAESYASDFDKGDLPLPPARKVAVLACMAPRRSSGSTTPTAGC
jgi:carbonic anhydrase